MKDIRGRNLGRETRKARFDVAAAILNHPPPIASRDALGRFCS